MFSLIFYYYIIRNHKLQGGKFCLLKRNVIIIKGIENITGEKMFDDKIELSEDEVNEILMSAVWNEDDSLIRKTLMDYGHVWNGSKFSKNLQSNPVVESFFLHKSCFSEFLSFYPDILDWSLNDVDKNKMINFFDLSLINGNKEDIEFFVKKNMKKKLSANEFVFLLENNSVDFTKEIVDVLPISTIRLDYFFVEMLIHLTNSQANKLNKTYQLKMEYIKELYEEFSSKIIGYHGCPDIEVYIKKSFFDRANVNIDIPPEKAQELRNSLDKVSEDFFKCSYIDIIKNYMKSDYLQLTDVLKINVLLSEQEKKELFSSYINLLTKKSQDKPVLISDQLNSFISSIKFLKILSNESIKNFIFGENGLILKEYMNPENINNDVKEGVFSSKMLKKYLQNEITEKPGLHKISNKKRL